MILAELEVFHSRPVAPTRRVALGTSKLPTENLPGFGGLLLGAIVARFCQALDPEMREELEILSYQVEQGQRIPQPRLRHRLQQDRVGLSRSVHRLRRLPNKRLHLDFDPTNEAPAQYVLAAVYTAGEFRPALRTDLMQVIRRAIGWNGDTVNSDLLLRHLSSTYERFCLGASTRLDPVAWALEVLGLDPDGSVPDTAVLRSRFRDQVRGAHPDSATRSSPTSNAGSATAKDAAERITALNEARRILLA